MAAPVDWIAIQKTHCLPGETLRQMFVRKLDELGSMERLGAALGGISYITIQKKCDEFRIGKKYRYYLMDEAEIAHGR